MLSFILHRIDLENGKILERFHHSEEWKMFFIVNNVNVLLRVKELKCILIMVVKLLNKFLFLEFLKILIRQNSVYWVITGKLFLLTRWLLFNRSRGNWVTKILTYYKNLWMIYIIIIYRYLMIVTKKYYTRNTCASTKKKKIVKLSNKYITNHDRLNRFSIFKR